MESNGIVISVLSQKGGVGKSKISQHIAMGFAYSNREYKVLLADMDSQQKSSCIWQEKRQNNTLPLIIDVIPFNNVSDAKKAIPNYDLVVFDGAPHATVQTLDMAKISDLILLPQNHCTDDMEPQVKLANEMVNKGIEVNRITFIFNRLSESESVRKAAYEYMGQTPYRVLDCYLEYKTSFINAFEMGKTFGTTTSGSLNARAQQLLTNISTLLLKLNK